MPISSVNLYQDESGKVPLLDWLDKQSMKVRIKCLVKIELLTEKGYELRRPHCDILEEGIFELRLRNQNIQYRILYFFHGENIIILTHGLTKEKNIPKADIQRAKEFRANYIQNPVQHTYKEEF